ncbi:MAG: NAD(P)-binding protein [Candidatus Caenarcaniphilales bacterium]|nr:NAD(P)-binding protein [Candidatus Caenarcaniphilales bacterium]
MEKIAIIGSGLSGCYLAYLLKDKYEVHIFDKARGTGGRASSKRESETSFDYGLSCFNIEDKAILQDLEKFPENLEKWQAGVLERDKYNSETNFFYKSELFTSKPFANSLCKKFIEEINHNFKSHRVLEIKKITEKNYELSIEKEEEITKISGFTKVISTAPNIQSAEITKNFPETSKLCLRAIMNSSFVVLISFQNELNSYDWLRNVDIIQFKNSPIDSVYFNNHKPGREGNPASIILKANPYWSKAHVEIDKKRIEKLLTEEFFSLCGIRDPEISFTHTHRWLYSETARAALEIKDYRHEKLFIMDKSKDSEQIYVCGDWCIGSKAEHALMSAKSLADHLSL